LGGTIIGIYKIEWARNLPRKTNLLQNLSRVTLVKLRAGQRIHQGDQRYAARVPAREDEAGVPRENSTERLEEEDREEGACCKFEPIQQSQKVVAAQILKNNQMVAKYDKLDAQLQGVTFEYSLP
jgi:hypothetical protein